MAPLPIPTSGFSSTDVGLPSQIIVSIVIGCMIFTCALIGMWCVYSKKQRCLCSCTSRRLGERSPPTPASNRRQGGTSFPTHMLPYKAKRASVAKEGANDDNKSMYSRETLQTPPPTYRPQSRCPPYEARVPATPVDLSPTRKYPALVPNNWPVSSKLAGGRPRNNSDSIPLVADSEPISQRLHCDM